MIESMFGKINVEEGNDYCTHIEFISEFEGNSVYLTTIDEKNLDRLIFTLNRIKENYKELKEKREYIITHTNINKIYNDMDLKYNPYPIMMSRAEAFGHALDDGIIDRETYEAIRMYYGKLWNYVGD